MFPCESDKHGAWIRKQVEMQNNCNSYSVEPMATHENTNMECSMDQERKSNTIVVVGATTDTRGQ